MERVIAALTALPDDAPHVLHQVAVRLLADPVAHWTAMPPHVRAAVREMLMLGDFVPQDGRGEYGPEKRYNSVPLLPSTTTLFQSRVAPATDSLVGPYMVFSHFFGLTLSHPCTVVLQHIHLTDKTGPAVVYEFETLRPIPLKRHIVPAMFDELYLASVVTDTIRDDMQLHRVFKIDRQLIKSAPILGFMFGNDVGGLADHESGKAPRDYPRHAPAGRAPDFPNPIPGGQLAVVATDSDRFDSDYLHMIQFWTKQRLIPDATTLQAILCGSDAVGRGTLRRHAWYVYDSSRVFTFDEPVVYRDEDHDRPRTIMSYVVGLVVAYSGTRDYPTHWRPRTPPVPMDYQATVVGIALEKGYEARALAAIDAALAHIPLIRGGGAFTLSPQASTWRAQLPMLQAACDTANIVLV